MPWQEFPDPDDTIHDWLKSLYPAYRNAQVDPSVLPAPDKIDWDSYWAGYNVTSFLVYESATNHPFMALGAKTINFTGIQIVRVTYRWISGGKPPELSKIRTFVVRKLQENVSPLPAALSNAGIVQMVPMESRMFVERNQTAQQDFWTLEVQVQTKVLNSIV